MITYRFDRYAKGCYKVIKVREGREDEHIGYVTKMQRYHPRQHIREGWHPQDLNRHNVGPNLWDTRQMAAEMLNLAT